MRLILGARYLCHQDGQAAGNRQENIQSLRAFRQAKLFPTSFLSDGFSLSSLPFLFLVMLVNFRAFEKRVFSLNLRESCNVCSAQEAVVQCVL